MADGRKNNGGARKGAGRKPKADEAKIRELLSPYRDKAIQTVVDIMLHGERESDRLNAAKLFMSYDWGLPNAKVEHSGDVNSPVIVNVIPDNAINEKADSSG